MVSNGEIQVFWDVAQFSLHAASVYRVVDYDAVKTEVVLSSSNTSVTSYQSTRRRVPEIFNTVNSAV
jgi:hypothetical protein